MRPVLLPAIERVGRAVLRSRGVSTRFVETSLGPVHVFDGPGRGSLPPVVVLQGLGSSTVASTPFIARLLPHVRRVVAPDYPGKGFSPEARARVTPDALGDAMVEALDALAGEPAIVVGNSLGGAVALRYAIARPAQVAGLVLLSPAGARSTEDEWRAIVASFDIRSRADAKSLFDRLYHEVGALMSRRTVREILAGATAEDAHDPAALGSLPMPVLLVWGKSDRLFPESHFAYYRRHLPPHTITDRPERIGHTPHGEAPAWAAERVLQFARQLP